MADDPLDEIAHLPIETQVAVVISVLRSTRNQLGRIEKKLDWVSRSIWALIGTIVAGVVVYYVTVGRTPQPQQQPSKAIPTVTVYRSPASLTPQTDLLHRAYVAGRETTR